MAPRTGLRYALVAPVRTPIGKFGGGLAPLSAADLGTAAVSACLERAGLDPNTVDQTIFGHGRQAGGGPNTARQVAFRSGIPQKSPAWTVNQACGSGLQSILAAVRAIESGEAEVVMTGGTESMSNTPYLLPRARWGYRLGHAELTDGMYRDGFNDPLSGMVMGATAEELADRWEVSREEADQWAMRSQNLCEAARKRGRFESETVPVEVSARRKTNLIESDEHPRDGITMAKLAKLPTVFRPGGTVTPGNASGITDGAAAIIVTTAEKAHELNLEVAGWLTGWNVVGVAPEIMGIGPIPAVQELLQSAELAFEEIEEVELNEAFATQVVACLRELKFDPRIVNPDGGSIALGHPIGCTASRIMVTLLHGMKERGRHLGLATLCVSGGMGLAALVEVDQ